MEYKIHLKIDKQLNPNPGQHQFIELSKTPLTLITQLLDLNKTTWTQLTLVSSPASPHSIMLTNQNVKHI
jgi:hypothetical protein